MDGLALLAQARDAGLEVRARGDRLVIRGPKRAENVARLLLDRKPVVLDALRVAAHQCADAPRRAHEAAVAAWINTNPPAQPDPDTCAACGKTLDGHFVVLGDGAAIHYSGPHGLTCWERYQRQRRHEAEAAMGLTPPAE